MAEESTNQIDLEALDPAVKAHIESLSTKVAEYESKEQETEGKLEEAAAQAEAKNKSLKEKLKAEGDLKSLVSEQELEIEQLKSADAKRKSLEKQMKETVLARAADLPEDVQALVKDLPPEVALKHMDTLLEKQAPADMPDTGAGFATGSSRAQRFTLNADQAAAAKWMSVSHQDYREAVHKMKTEEVF